MSDKPPACTCGQLNKSWTFHDINCEVFYYGCAKTDSEIYTRMN